MSTIKLTWTPEEDATLLRLAAEKRLTYVQIGQRLRGRSKVAVGARLHLLRRGLKKYAWSADEDAFLRDTAGYKTAAAIAAELGRTANAVHTRASLLGIRWMRPVRGRNHTGFTASEVARLLGIPCAKAVTDWIRKGYLEASRRAPRMDSGPRLAYRVYPESLRVFLRDYPWLYDWRRVQDRGWRAYVDTLPREEWLGTRAAADLLFLTEQGVALAIRKGDLRAEKVGANWVIPISAIRAYVAPPFGGKRTSDELRAKRAANTAARRSVTYTQRPETVARAEASRRARREREAA